MHSKRSWEGLLREAGFLVFRDLTCAKEPSSGVGVHSCTSNTSVVGDCGLIGVRSTESAVEVVENELERPGTLEFLDIQLPSASSARLETQGEPWSSWTFPQRLSNSQGDSDYRPHQVVIDVVLKVLQEVCNVRMSYSTEKPNLGWESTKLRILHPGMGRHLFPYDELDGNVTKTTSA